MEYLSIYYLSEINGIILPSSVISALLFHSYFLIEIFACVFYVQSGSSHEKKKKKKSADNEKNGKKNENDENNENEDSDKSDNESKDEEEDEEEDEEDRIENDNPIDWLPTVSQIQAIFLPLILSEVRKSQLTIFLSFCSFLICFFNSFFFSDSCFLCHEYRHSTYSFTSADFCIHFKTHFSLFLSLFFFPFSFL